jgi:hypothetical protein
VARAQGKARIGALYVSYNGIIQFQKEVLDRFVRGEMLRTGDCYLITAPTFENANTSEMRLRGCRTQSVSIPQPMGAADQLL